MFRSYGYNKGGIKPLSGQKKPPLELIERLVLAFFRLSPYFPDNVFLICVFSTSKLSVVSHKDKSVREHCTVNLLLNVVLANVMRVYISSPQKPSSRTYRIMSHNGKNMFNRCKFVFLWTHRREVLRCNMYDARLSHNTTPDGVCAWINYVSSFVFAG